jgi:hypothetical protein
MYAKRPSLLKFVDLLKATLNRGLTGCHNVLYIFFTLYVSSHLGRMVYNQKVVLEPQWGKIFHGEIGQFSLMILISPVFSTVFGVFHL